MGANFTSINPISISGSANSIFTHSYVLLVSVIKDNSDFRWCGKVFVVITTPRNVSISVTNLFHIAPLDTVG